MEHEGQAGQAGQVTVSDIETRLTATREEIDAIERALAAIPEKKESLLGAPHFDDTALAKLETTEATLSRKKEYLLKRIPLLEKQLEEVAAGHAQERITELVTETANLRKEYDSELSAYEQEAGALKQRTEKLVGLHDALHRLWDEQTYLVERYQEFSVEPGPLTDAGALPDHDADARSIYESLRMWKLSRGIGSTSEWDRKTARLVEERSSKANPNPSGFVPGHVRVA